MIPLLRNLFKMWTNGLYQYFKWVVLAAWKKLTGEG